MVMSARFWLNFVAVNVRFLEVKENFFSNKFLFCAHFISRPVLQHDRFALD